MSEYKLSDYIRKYIKGGYDGLENLYINYFLEFKKENYTYIEIPFSDFVNGKVIEVQYRDGEIKEYKISTFFEKQFNYEFQQNERFIFRTANHIISQIDAIATDTVSNENDKRLSLIKLVKYIEFEIYKSNKCIEADNPILYQTLQYFKEDFINIYNEIFDLYSPYFPNIKREDFGVNSEKLFLHNTDSKTKTTQEISYKLALMFATGEITIIEKNVLKYDNIKISGNSLALALETIINEKPQSVKSYLNDTRNDYEGRKNIFKTANLKIIQSVFRHCELNSIEMTDYFKDKLKKMQHTNI